MIANDSIIDLVDVCVATAAAIIEWPDIWTVRAIVKNVCEVPQVIGVPWTRDNLDGKHRVARRSRWQGPDCERANSVACSAVGQTQPDVLEDASKTLMDGTTSRSTTPVVAPLNTVQGVAYSTVVGADIGDNSQDERMGRLAPAAASVFDPGGDRAIGFGDPRAQAGGAARASTPVAAENTARLPAVCGPAGVATG
jgi:hypothetical protein